MSESMQRYQHHHEASCKRCVVAEPPLHKHVVTIAGQWLVSCHCPHHIQTFVDALLFCWTGYLPSRLTCVACCRYAKRHGTHAVCHLTIAPCCVIASLTTMSWKHEAIEPDCCLMAMNSCGTAHSCNAIAVSLSTD